MTGADQTGAAGSRAPVFRFVHGRPTEEEIAAVVAVLSARASVGAPASPGGAPGSEWGAYWRSVGAPVAPGRGRWRAAVRDW